MVMGEMAMCLGRYDGYQGGVKAIRKVCQLMERCDVYWGCKGVLEGVKTFRRCENYQGGVKGI